MTPVPPNRGDGGHPSGTAHGCCMCARGEEEGSVERGSGDCSSEKKVKLMLTSISLGVLTLKECKEQYEA